MSDDSPVMFHKEHFKYITEDSQLIIGERNNLIISKLQVTNLTNPGESPPSPINSQTSSLKDNYDIQALTNLTMSVLLLLPTDIDFYRYDV